MENNIFMVLDNNIFKYIALTWIIFIGCLFFITYIFYEKSNIFKAIGDFFINFSFVKRTKTILLSYGFLCIFVGIVGLFFLVYTSHLKKALIE